MKPQIRKTEKSVATMHDKLVETEITRYEQDGQVWFTLSVTIDNVLHCCDIPVDEDK